MNARKADPTTLSVLEDMYPRDQRALDAKALGISKAMLNHIVAGLRRPNDMLAQRLSILSGGRLVVARLRWWDDYDRPRGCRVFDTDPMPLAVAAPGLVFRDRESDRALIVYLEGLAEDPLMPAEHRDQARELAAALRPVQGVRP